MNTYDIYVGGTFKKTDEVLQVVNPYTGLVFAETYLGGEKDLEAAIVKALSVENVMRELRSFQRYKILCHISKEITRKKDHLSSVLAQEAGKPLVYAAAEIDRSAQTFLIAAEESKRLPREYISLDWSPAGINREGIVKYFPIGLVAGISPFNFPMNLAAHKIAPAMAAGCPIILKPASATPLSTLELAKIVDETPLPKGALSIIPMSRSTGGKLVTDERFKLLTFTGSPEVGWQMKKQAGKKKVVLELGGNAGVIVTGSADIDFAVKRCLIGGFAYSGQVCIHAQRIFVEKPVFDEFTEKFVEGAKNLKSGDPLDPKTQISVMIDEPNAKRVETWVREAIDGGARLLCGGNKNGPFFEPTVLSHTEASMKVNCLEIFGPVVTLEHYEDFQEAVRSVNDTPFGLQAGVFTNRLDEINMAFDRLDVGGVIINDVPTFRVDHMPYGGIKDSGLGREGVKYAIYDMMEPKILVQPSSYN
ncbi:MAG: aldehyde dehydrogenase family protein [Deltaproteobacteria bacterium]|nr:aldehyde dehydrogenase family protein [Deltaproteobacteria bacterium]